MVIATPNGALATRDHAGGKSNELHSYGDNYFTAGTSDMLAAGQYISAGVLDDAQRRKQEVYRSLLGDAEEDNDDPLAAAAAQSKGGPAGKDRAGPTPPEKSGRSRANQFPSVPTPLGWTTAAPLGFRYPEAQQTLGAALVAIPLTIERPAPGTVVTLPSAFLPYKVTRGRYGSTPAVFVEERVKWNASSVPGTLPLTFRVPQELLPLTVEKAKFTLDINGPGTAVEVLLDKGGNLTTIDKRSSPGGVIELDLPAADVQPNERGEILVIFRITYLNAGERTLWRVREAKLEVKGKVGGK
jgi:hypothetical protein